MNLRLQLRHAMTPPVALRVLAVAVALFLAGFLVVWGIDLGRRMGLLGAAPAPIVTPQVDQQALLQTELSKLQLERDRLAAVVAAAAIKSAAAAKTQEQQASKIKALELENSKLNEDLSSLKHPAPVVPPVKSGARVAGGAGKALAKAAAKAHGGAAIRRAEARMSAPNQLHYRLLITGGARKPVQPPGHLQFVLRVVRAGKPAVLKFPNAGAASTPQFVIKLGKLQRCEGVLTLPDGVTIKSIQARMLEKGQVRSSQSVTLKDAAHVRS
jgi:hypothetical protein